jgi:hypothetical protein
MRILATGRFLPGDCTPDVAVALRDTDGGNTIGYLPVTGRISGESRGKTCGEKKSGINYCARYRSWAVQHGSNLCLSLKWGSKAGSKRRIEHFQLTKWLSTEVSSEC